MSIETPIPPAAARTQPDDGTKKPNTNRRRRIRTIALLFGAPVLVAVVAYFAFMQFRPYLYSGTVLQSPSAAPAMDELIYADGSAVDLSAFNGDVVVVYFGYTHCPDVCPTTLVKAAKAVEQLGDSGHRVHVMMVSVDPERDAPEALGVYVESFHPSFLGATGERAAIERVTAQYGVFAARGEDLGDGDYAVDHTSSLMGIDQDGHLRILWPTDISIEALASDLDELL